MSERDWVVASSKLSDLLMGYIRYANCKYVRNILWNINSFVNGYYSGIDEARIQQP